MSQERKGPVEVDKVLDEEERDRSKSRSKHTNGKRKRSRRKKDQGEENKKKQKRKLTLDKWSAEVKTKLQEKGRLNAIKEKKESADEVKLRWFGDKIEHDEDWPNKTRDGIFRIMSQNINGTPTKDDYLDWEMLLDNVNNLQADIICLSELNLDVNKAEVAHKLIEKAKKMDMNMKVKLTTSKTSVNTSNNKRGGTAALVRGNWSGHVKKMSKDKLGRWVSIEMIGKGARTIKIISTYRVCEQKHNQGSCTIYMQQQNDLIQEKREETDPREALLDDMSRVIAEDHKEGKIVILAGDMNEPIGSSKKLQSFLRNNNLYNAVEAKHIDLYPATYDRGRECLDLIAISNGVRVSAIKRSGYLPFYEGYMSDHRALYIDIEAKEIFTNANPNTNLMVYKRFTTDRVKKCDRYIQLLESYILEAKIEKKVEKLRWEMERHLEEGGRDEKKMIEECKKLCEKVAQLMTASEKRVGRKQYNNGYPSSRKLKEAGNAVFEARKKMRYEKTKKHSDAEKIYEHVVDIKDCKRALKETQKNATKEREDDLLLLAEKRAEEWNLTAAKAIIVIKEAEVSRKMHRKQRQYLKPVRDGHIQRILVPAPVQGIVPQERHVTDASVQYTVEDPKEIFNILLRQNYKSLLKSQESVFSSGMMKKLLDDRQSETVVINQILEGTFDSENTSDAKETYGSTIENILQSMRKATTKSGGGIENFQWKYGKEEFKETFTKTRENTSCGPSGLHMSHWKAATQSELLMEIHSFFIWAAFAYGFSHNRWENSWHCMLKKKSQPFSQKLRIIQLFEGDLNGGLKYLLGKVLMWHIHQNGIIDDDIYGSRVGKTGAEALITLQLIADYARIWKVNMAILFNDADGCFDRIPPIGRIGFEKNWLSILDCENPHGGTKKDETLCQNSSWCVKGVYSI